MEFRVEIEGLDRIDKATARVRQMVATELHKGMAAGLLKVEGEAKRAILSGEKTGRVYKRRSVAHRASAPGEAPASDTGLLVNSIRGRIDKVALSGGSLEGTVTVGVSYGKFLEFGTRTTAPRPFLFPAFEKSKAFIRERLDRAVRKAAIDASK